jgi:hypothetical protein
MIGNRPEHGLPATFRPFSGSGCVIVMNGRLSTSFP